MAEWEPDTEAEELREKMEAVGELEEEALSVKLNDRVALRDMVGDTVDVCVPVGVEDCVMKRLVAVLVGVGLSVKLYERVALRVPVDVTVTVGDDVVEGVLVRTSDQEYE